MKTTLLALIAAFGAGFATPLHAGVLAGPITNTANGHFYYLLTQSTWTAAESEAVRLGGHLATINDAAENDWVVSEFSIFGGVLRSLWIGLSRQGQEFRWSSGESSAFTAWEAGQPSTVTNEDFVHIWPLGGSRSPGRWNDLFDQLSVQGYPLHGVVEVVPTVLSIQVASVQVAWNTETNRSYQLQYSSSLTSNTWMNLGAPVSGTGTNVSVIDTVLGEPRRFYRVLPLPQ